MIPSDMAVGDEAGVDEERRLFYVAMTRAKDMLYVYFPLRYYYTRFSTGDLHNFAQLTRFLPPPVRGLFQQRATMIVNEDDDHPRLASEREPYSRVNRLWED
jgi:superfamily I DNA/RNA helicase